MSKPIIPLSVPNICGNEWQYVKECLDTGWISTVGNYVNKFEEMVAQYTDVRYGIAAMNGTAALHACLVVAGVSCGDLVILPNITFVATANAVRYTGADPVLIDADDKTWQMDLDLLEEFLESETDPAENGRLHKATNRRITAVIPVHVQGNMFDMTRFGEIVERFNLFAIEDAAEALGSTFDNRKAGGFCRLGCFSFNGNKIISTGGGGMVVTDDELLAKRLKHLTTTAKVDPMEYLHDEVGYNYRLVNVLAAIGVAQMEQLDSFVQRKREIAEFYLEQLSGVGDISFQQTIANVNSNWWLFTIRTERQRSLLPHLNQNGIISRPFWMPMTKLPMFADCLYVQRHDRSTRIHQTCLAIPGSTNITESELARVVDEIKRFYA